MKKTFNQAVVPGALILRPQPPALLLDRHYWWLTMAWNGQRGRVDIDGASETLQRKEREGRKEEKNSGRQGLKVKKTHAHTIIIFVIAIIYTALTIFQTVPYPSEFIEASERSLR